MAEIETREAKCCCGQLRIVVQGAPKKVLACSCDYCQRRTGAVMQQSAWFSADQIVSKGGEKKICQPEGLPFMEYYFCPECGSTVYWPLPPVSAFFGIELYGIAVGNFADPNFPKPSEEAWADKRHKWLDGLGFDSVHSEFPEEWSALD